ncbi:hypothetical protein [Salinispora arenicola]|uniref:hypothetical protein n=1 Tax=Salinispora arenicola TaxID=168697 RepID=UPI0012BD1D5E|nr:hypothetical protein [Salinispora arenicola]NIL59535.1 hypothetical protein [Salinispora arenicola]NIL63017.1 hypothetical protein [Salinispora arenicola]
MAALGLLAAGAVGLTAAGPAAAAGTSDPRNNCYTQWWNTAWAQKCGSAGASDQGLYTSTAHCSGVDRLRTLTEYRKYRDDFTAKGSDCLWSVKDGLISYEFALS